MEDCIRGLTEVQVNDILQLFAFPLMQSLYCRRPLAQFGMICCGEVMLAVSNQLSLFHMHCCMFQDDPFRDLTRHRGEADGHWFPCSAFLPFLKMGVMFPFLQSLGLHLTAMTFQIWWSGCGLATTLVNYVSNLRCILLGLMDLCMFSFFTCS